MISHLLLWPIHEAFYRLWCAWRGHIGEPERVEMWKGHEVVIFRVCRFCDRVWPQDVEPALARIERELPG